MRSGPFGKKFHSRQEWCCMPIFISVSMQTVVPIKIILNVNICPTSTLRLLRQADAFSAIRKKQHWSADVHK